MLNADEEDYAYQINVEAVLYRLRYPRYLLHIRASITPRDSIRCTPNYPSPGVLWESSGVIFRSSISARHIENSRVVYSNFG